MKKQTVSMLVGLIVFPISAAVLVIRYNIVMKRSYVVLMIIALSVCSSILAFYDGDFIVYYTAGAALRFGLNPYLIYRFNSPIVVAALFAPLTFIPYTLAFRLSMFFSTAVILIVFWRASQDNWFLFLVACLMPMFLFNFFYYNIDWMAFFAMLLLPVYPIPAFLLAMTKPQTGLVLVLLVSLNMFRKRRYSWLTALVMFQAFNYGLSFAAGMRWDYLLDRPGNWSLFPLSIIIGLPLAIYSLKHYSPEAGLAAATLLSPYVGPQSWIAVVPFILSALHQAMMITKPLPPRPPSPPVTPPPPPPPPHPKEPPPPLPPLPLAPLEPPPDPL